MDVDEGERLIARSARFKAEKIEKKRQRKIKLLREAKKAARLAAALEANPNPNPNP